MVLLLGGIVKGILIASTGRSQPARVLGICITLALSGVLLHALIDFPLQIVSLSLLSLCLAGLVWGYGLKGRESDH
jgi:membrane protein implicated in regulation of membrane protease activity